MKDPLFAFSVWLLAAVLVMVWFGWRAVVILILLDIAYDAARET